MSGAFPDLLDNNQTWNFCWKDVKMAKVLIMYHHQYAVIINLCEMGKAKPKLIRVLNLNGWNQVESIQGWTMYEDF
jgi:hypothetical protein